MPSFVVFYLQKTTAKSDYCSTYSQRIILQNLQQSQRIILFETCSVKTFICRHDSVSLDESFKDINDIVKTKVITKSLL